MIAFVITVFVAPAIGVIGYLTRQLGKPLTATDEWCSRVDAQLDREREYLR
jgi:hypothetical protein